MYQPTIEEIKQLREMTLAPIMSCKEALIEAQGDLDEALKILRQKGIFKASSKAEREVGAGIIDSYIHNGSQIGVLLELRTETDFVARNEEFKKLAHELGVQIASMNPAYIEISKIPAEVINEKKEEFSESLKAIKDEKKFEKALEGKLNSWYEEVVLLEQIYYKDQNLKIKDLITNAIATFGENIRISKFARFEI
jgi:elongation factor Ts